MSPEQKLPLRTSDFNVQMRSNWSDPGIAHINAILAISNPSTFTVLLLLTLNICHVVLDEFFRCQAPLTPKATSNYHLPFTH
ncbi:CIC11C00000002473 [Sungouiella intermedia]|uniref:CIC11C00000002473 n=1 Tax=Sungouiella intermedia TaxID=45354 RepID=A0A1L0BRX5_9ASCO|nr:CIC11C00000002473 [[Candida] intermedia]